MTATSSITIVHNTLTVAFCNIKPKETVIHKKNKWELGLVTDHILPSIFWDF